jgi:glycosyltransferase involved in cell wall biosynthesis
MRLTLVITSLGCGGAERTASVLASAWAEQGAEVTLITLNRDDIPAFPLHPRVRLEQLRVRGGRAKNILHGIVRQLRSVHALRRAIRVSSPGMIVSFMDVPNVLTILAAQGLGAPVVITEHVHPAYYNIGWAWQTLRRLVYRRAAILVCVSKPLLDWFQSRIKVHGAVIANPVALPFVAASGFASPAQAKKGHVIVGMGRLVEQKGFDLLLEAFSRVAERHSDWTLRILGEGPLKNRLCAHATELKIVQRVEFTGALTDPFPVLREADLFVFSSRFEGFGNALCEAMACGLPVISFDCPSGPSDIVRPGVDGVLVPAGDVNALAEAMDRLMGDSQLRLRLGSRALEVVSRFGINRILELWRQMFADLLNTQAARNRKT